MGMIMDIIDKSAWIHLRDRKILTTLSKGKDVYYIPGGKPEGTESSTDALIREIKEELSVDIRPTTVQMVGVFEAQAHGKREGVIVRMTCFTGEYDGKLSAASEIERIVWLAYVDKPMTSPVDQIIFDWLHARDLLD